MPELFGGELSRDELQQRVGSIAQVAGIRPFRFLEGRADGLKAAEVRTGSGLAFTVLLDRGMDLGHAEFRGLPVSWDSKNGAAGPGYFERPGQGWLRTFGGGLLVTCGLTQSGPPNTDAGEELGLHGRVSHLPAERYELEEGWEGDDYVLRVRGRVRESVIYGENLLLKREIACRMGGTTITVSDVIENQGYQETPFMLLYHLNFGFPVVSEHTRLLTSGFRAEAGNEEARRGDGVHDRFQPPTPGYAYQVFNHRPPADRPRAYAALINERLSYGAWVSWSPQELPCFSEWKMMGQQDYVVGLEPGTNFNEGRAEARRGGRLITLRPGGSRRAGCEIGILKDRRDIEDLARKMNA